MTENYNDELKKKINSMNKTIDVVFGIVIGFLLGITFSAMILYASLYAVSVIHLLG